MNTLPLSLKRWIDLIFLTVVAVLVSVLLYPLFYRASNLIDQATANWIPSIRYLAVLLIAGVLWMIVIRLGGFRFSDLKFVTFFRYPPTWFFGIVSAIGYLIAIIKYNNLYKIDITADATALAVPISAVFAGFFLAGLVNVAYVRSRQQPEGPAPAIVNINNILHDQVSLFQWLEVEEPITHPSQDLFSLSQIAKRIAQILRRYRLRSVGIVGQYGSGKSSLLNLVAFYLKQPVPKEETAESYKGNFIVCRVDGWGRYQGSIAQQILGIVISSLKGHIDCLSIITVPANYREALHATKSPLASIIAAVLNTNEDPVKTLKQIDTILSASKMRLIIFIEDLDRNISDSIIKEEVPALLDRLHYLKNMSFVLAIGTEQRYSGMLIRLCDYVESLI